MRVLGGMRLERILVPTLLAYQEGLKWLNLDPGGFEAADADLGARPH